jgi:hypothetical protein
MRERSLGICRKTEVNVRFYSVRKKHERNCFFDATIQIPPDHVVGEAAPPPVALLEALFP